MKHRKTHLLRNSISLLLFLSSIVLADSGGTLSPQQAAYDVTFYDLDLTIHPEEKTISGSALVRAEIIKDLDSLVLDLDDAFMISSIIVRDEGHGPAEASFLHTAGKIYIDIPWDVMIGDIISARIYYQGPPKVSGNPPWDDGFVWGETSSGHHWIGVACETGGGDIWWPCKDHPSDEPDSVALHFTVPIGLTCVSNGIFMGSHRNGIDAMTFEWFVSTPINNYNVTLYIANYQEIEGMYTSINGESIPFYFWVLPEAYDVAQSHLPVFLDEFNFLEKVSGPFPFSSDKHGWAQAPYWGMEHQTIIAYGHDFKVNGWGMDYIHLHELAHEWWGNLVTAKDWSDLWIHEGLATYMEALYVEHISGFEIYHQYMNQRRPDNTHEFPLAPISTMTASEAFDALNSYRRGAWVMHTLRHHLGDEDFFSLLNHWSYPDTSDTDNTDGRLCRLATTNDMKIIAEQVTSRDLDPFFDVFLREASYPYIEIEYFEGEARLNWVTENDILLDVNVPVSINGSPEVVEMNSGQGSISLPPQAELIIDPEQWILMDEPVVTTVDEIALGHAVEDFNLYQNYPNPFNPTTIINYELPITNYTELSIYNSLGQKVVTLVSEIKKAGSHQVAWDADNFASGVYIYKISAGEFQEVKKMILLR